VEVTESVKHSSLLRNGIIYDCKKLDSNGPSELFEKQFFSCSFDKTFGSKLCKQLGAGLVFTKTSFDNHKINILVGVPWLHKTYVKVFAIVHPY
jgi:hypothetical protein